jgi:hypothetical protein
VGSFLKGSENPWAPCRRKLSKRCPTRGPRAAEPSGVHQGLRLSSSVPFERWEPRGQSVFAPPASGLCSPKTSKSWSARVAVFHYFRDSRSPLPLNKPLPLASGRSKSATEARPPRPGLRQAGSRPGDKGPLHEAREAMADSGVSNWLVEQARRR